MIAQAVWVGEQQAQGQSLVPSDYSQYHRTSLPAPPSQGLSLQISLPEPPILLDIQSYLGGKF